MDVQSYLLGKKAGGGSGSNLQTKSVTVTENGSTTINPDENYDGMTKVNLTTNVQPNLESKSETITSNTTTTITPTQGKDGLSSVKITTNVQPNLETLSDTITTNTTTTYTPSTGKDGFSSVSITTNVPTGSVEIEEKDVNFFDYKGNIVHSYTAQEFQNLSALPEAPEHTGMTFQEWNWTLIDAKTYVTNHGGLDIGETCVTSDGKTKLYIELVEGRLSPTLRIAVNGTAVIDWGDNSETDTITANNINVYQTKEHNYASAGKYVINIQISENGKIGFTGYQSNGILTGPALNAGSGNVNRAYSYCIEKMELGNGVVISSYCFQELKIKTLNLPSDFSTSGTYTFYYAPIEYITIPKTRTFIGQSDFRQSSLKRISLPKGITDLGQYAFENSKLQKIYLPDTLTTINQYAFQSCYFLEKCIISNGLTTMYSTGYQFNNCKGLNTIILPNTLSFIPPNAFAYSGLVNIKCLGNITAFGVQCLTSLKFIKILDLRNNTSVATFNNVFGGTWTTDMQIIVPDSLYEDWIATSGWSTYTDYIIKASDYEE